MGELATDQTAVLAAFKASCTAEGLLAPREGLQDGDVPDGINDDATLLRYLDARKMDPEAALQQFQEATKFHTEKHVLQLYDRISLENYEETRKMYPHWTGQRDRQGQPILMFDIAHWDSSTIATWQKTRQIPCNSDVASTAINPVMIQRAAIHFDTITRFVLPLCSAMADRPDPATPITKAVYIVDASSLGIKQSWDVRDVARDISGLLTTCYPETIDRIFVGNAPFYFPRIWAFMKHFVDPVTAEKLVITKSADAYDTMLKHVDHDKIPSQFGGGFKFTTGMLPELDEGIRQALQWTNLSKEGLPPGPIKWMEDAEGRRRAVATGRVDDMQRTEEIAILRV
ncbi:CRAL/TRIO domain-containing protein [Aspergillus sclerotioniger CBS 115572]|uniref:CRAL/TRIO domain-containing protein n=1 Tax=Aspergillus sclerotioniger CBS 115572 TaxID=1450535 RepID=A0A317V0A5_9EURO|nr:CRAL/TRIO domain-containing protein [Aspergillus sclerotioniger CBS 115572]PWY67089.1 CRAL/TRIO domain-containing protein [Aspergillus sclerotioniger CBS 115572]